MFNSRILLSAASIAAAGALVIGATFALFSDTNSSTGNIFAAGTLELQLDDVSETVTSSPISASFGGSNMAPGGTPVTGFISLHNSGTINASSVTTDVSQTAAVNNGSGDLPTVIDVTVKKDLNSNCVDDSGDLTDLTTGIQAQLSDSGTLTLAELRDFVSPINLPALPNGGTYYLCFSAQMQSGAGNEYQGDSATETFAFTATQ